MNGGSAPSEMPKPAIDDDGSATVPRGPSAKRIVSAGIAAVALAFLTAFGTRIYERISEWFNRNDLVAVSFESNPDRIHTNSGPVGASYVLDAFIADVGPPSNNADDCVGRYEWATKLGGSPADATHARITVEALQPAVQLSDITIRVVKRAPPMTGTHLTCGGKGEASTIRLLAVSLDDERPTVATTDGSGQPIPFHFSLNQTEQEVFELSAQTVGCTCQWRVELVARRGDRSQKITIPPPSSPPFTTVSSLGSRSYRWINGSWVDIERSSSAPTTGQQPGPRPEDIPACRLLTKTEIDSALGRPATLVSGFNSDGAGAARPVRETYCTYAVVPSPPPPSDQPHDGINVSHSVAQDEASAKAEVAKRLQLYARGASIEPVGDVGDEAFFTNGVVVVRRGAEFVVVGITVQDRTRERSVINLGRITARRVWGH